jgi:hypothetical protein
MRLPSGRQWPAARGMSSPDFLEQRVEKIMAIRRDEFEAGLARLTDRPFERDPGGAYLVPDTDPADPVVSISFEPLEDAVLGGLLRLPRARVVLDLTTIAADQRAAFVTRFDRTFQRGGG